MDVQGLAGVLGAGAADLATELAAELAAGVVLVRTRGGFGAGTVWRSDGTIVTNHHVSPGDDAEVAGADGTFAPARVVARDVPNDLAVLRADHPIGTPVRVGDARRLRQGELVLALGHPGGVRWALSTGVVTVAPSARPEGRELIRSDAPLAPGNSGGPLADARGRVVGINAMIGGGMGLAVPSHLVERLAGQGATAERPVLGIVIREVALGPTLQGRAPVGVERGALIVRVAAGGAADRAGLIPGDVIVGVDGQTVRGLDDVERSLATHTGGQLRLLLLRGGFPREVVVLPARPERRAA